jgi:hypothetical protein
MTTDVKDMLAEREARYGSFEQNAKTAQMLQTAMHMTPQWGSLSWTHREALEMVAHKIARILGGDPNYIDNWLDIAGYATLVANRLEKA